MKTLKVLLQEVVSGIKAWVNSNFAQESNTVHKTGDETVNGNKYLTGYIRHTLTYDCIQSTAFDVRTDPEANRGRDIFRFWEGDRSSLGDYLGGMSYFQETDGSSRLQLICFGYPTTGNPSQQRINFHAYRDGTGSFYPVRNDVNLGSSAYQWNNLYAKNYYYNGTAWGLDQNNAWTGSNGFSNTVSLSSSSVTYNQAPSSNVELPSIRIFGGGRYCGAFDYIWKSTGENVIRLSLGSYKSDGTFGYWSCNFGIPRDFSDGGKFGTPAFYPNNDNAYNLGDSTHRWKSFNGVNPGALSLPNYNNVLDVTSEVPVASLDGNTDINLNDYVPNKTGWLSIVIANTAGNFIKAVQGRAGTALGFNASRTYHSGAADNEVISLFMPIIAGTWKSVYIKASSLIQMRFYYCQGNV